MDGSRRDGLEREGPKGEGPKREGTRRESSSTVTVPNYNNLYTVDIPITDPSRMEPFNMDSSMDSSMDSNMDSSMDLYSMDPHNMNPSEPHIMVSSSTNHSSGTTFYDRAPSRIAYSNVSPYSTNPSSTDVYSTDPLSRGPSSVDPFDMDNKNWLEHLDQRQSNQIGYVTEENYITVMATQESGSEDEMMDASFAVHDASWFLVGRVFKTPWGEPKKTPTTGLTRILESKESRRDSSVSIRYFIVVEKQGEHCLCIPFSTSGGQTTLAPTPTHTRNYKSGPEKRNSEQRKQMLQLEKQKWKPVERNSERLETRNADPELGVNSEHHALVYTRNRAEILSMSYSPHSPIRIVPNMPWMQLSSPSYLDYTRIYPIECNVKVSHIGEVDQQSLQELRSTFLEYHPRPNMLNANETLATSLSPDDQNPNFEDTSKVSSAAGEPSSTSTPPSEMDIIEKRLTSLLSQALSISSILDHTHVPLSATEKLQLEVKVHRLVESFASRLSREINPPSWNANIKRFRVVSNRGEGRESGRAVEKFIGPRARHIAHVLCTRLFDKSTMIDPPIEDTGSKPKDEAFHESDNTDKNNLQELKGGSIKWPPSFPTESDIKSSISLDWLRVNVKLALNSTSMVWQESQVVIDKVWPRSLQVTRPYTIEYSITWELPMVLIRKFPKTQSIRDVMTITGDQVNAKAASCEQYLNDTWPSVSRQLLEALDKILTGGTTSYQFVEENMTIAMEMDPLPQTDRQDQKGDLQNHGSYETMVNMSITATYEYQVYISSAISWLTRAIRYSIDEHLCISESSICVIEHKTTKRRLSFLRIKLPPLAPVLGTGSCWHSLFAYTVIAKGFPIKDRIVGHGLEIDLLAAFNLAGSLKLIEYNGGLIAEGLTTLLVPITELSLENSMQWHLISKPLDQGNGTYERPRTSKLLEAELTCGWYKTLSTDDLLKKRAFIGWTQDAEVLLGTASATGTIKLSGAAECKPGKLRITEYNIRGVTSGMSIFGISGSASFTASRIASRFVPQREKHLTFRLQDACTNYATLYDYENKTAWCIPETSLILYMAHYIICHRKIDVWGDGNVTQLMFSARSADGGTEALMVLQQSLNLQLRLPNYPESMQTFSELVESIFLSLDTVADNLASNFNNPDRGNKAAPSWILGYEFVDIAMEARVLTLRQQQVEQPWAHIVEENGVVLFCSGLGSVIAPREADGLCNEWQIVPPGNNFLVASGYTVASILERHSNTSGSCLSDSVHWLATDPFVESHGCGVESNCTHVQSLELVGSPIRQRDLGLKLKSYLNAAFIFDRKNRRRPFVATPTARRSEIQTQVGESVRKGDTVDQTAVVIRTRDVLKSAIFRVIK